MTNFVVAILVILLFSVLLHVTGIVERTKEVLIVGRRAAEAMQDSALTDADKERQIQQGSLRLFRLLGILIISSAFAILTPITLLWLGDIAGYVSFDGVLQMFMQWDFILAGTVLGIVAYVASVKWLRKSS